ncbi:hypothetical protein H5410_016984 [Solanum commersonii]|uniref:Uncharacterized protein n=1 Tax=Solanum commersonii TaxID=4109 RepID=A0A9J5ZY43_SOLCO|nr:hypothetical protein H5410_016984 [Solanum commersonii]
MKECRFIAMELAIIGDEIVSSSVLKALFLLNWRQIQQLGLQPDLYYTQYRFSYLSTNLNECHKWKIEQESVYDCLNLVVELQGSIRKHMCCITSTTMEDLSAFPKRKCSLVFCNHAVHRRHKQDHCLTSLDIPTGFSGQLPK